MIFFFFKPASLWLHVLKWCGYNHILLLLYSFDPEFFIDFYPSPSLSLSWFLCSSIHEFCASAFFNILSLTKPFHLRHFHKTFYEKSWHFFFGLVVVVVVVVDQCTEIFFPQIANRGDIFRFSVREILFFIQTHTRALEPGSKRLFSPSTLSKVIFLFFLFFISSSFVCHTPSYLVVLFRAN